MTDSEEYLLRVDHLSKQFTSGYGKHRITVKAVDDISFAKNVPKHLDWSENPAVGKQLRAEQLFVYMILPAVIYTLITKIYQEK